MKRSVEFVVSPAQHVKDRKRAERALGHPLKRSQPVHHFTETQLVICENAAYHSLLHEAAYYKRIDSDPAFGEAEIAKVEAQTARIVEETRLLRRIVEKHLLGASSVIDRACAIVRAGGTWTEAAEVMDRELEALRS